MKRQLGLRDLVLSQILFVVGSATVGIAAGLGRGMTLTWVAAMLIFYLPMAAVVIALNRLMPLEGGLYVWARRAFGSFGGFLTAWNLWIYGLLLVATVLYALPTELSYLIGPSAAWLPENRPVSLGIIALTLGAGVVLALRGLDIAKWIHNAGGIAMLVVFAGLVVLPLWARVRHQPIHWHPFSLELPPHDMRSFALFGQMVFGALSGLEYIAILAGETRQPARSIGQSVWIASPVICLMFILGTGSVAAWVPYTRIDFIAPIPQTLRWALGHSGLGNLLATAAIALVEMRLLGVASYVFNGLTRLPMATGWDALAPAWFTRLHPRWHTPSHSILFAGVLIFALVTMGSAGVHAQEAYQVLTNASLTHYEIAYLAMFAIPLVGSAALRKALPRWLRWTSVVGFGATLFSLLISAYPFVTVVNARSYAAKIIGMTVVSNVVGALLYKTQTSRRTEADAPLAVVAEAERS